MTKLSGVRRGSGTAGLDGPGEDCVADGDGWVEDGECRHTRRGDNAGLVARHDEQREENGENTTGHHLRIKDW